MRTIFKHIIEPGPNKLILPANSLPKTVLAQGNNIVVYVETDSEWTATEDHIIHVYGTGWPITHNGGDAKFLGTVQTQMGLVFHIYHS